MRAAIRDLFDAILSGDTSIATVNRLERVLLEHHSDTRLYARLSEPLALYNPGGGSDYVDDVELAGLIRELRPNIDDLLAKPHGK